MNLCGLLILLKSKWKQEITITKDDFCGSQYLNTFGNQLFFIYLFCVDGDCLMATWASSDKALSGELGLMRIP